MGTNYYVRPQITTDEQVVLEKFGYDKPYLHLGKCSYGWCFCFQGLVDEWFMGEKITLRSWSDWREFIIDNNLLIEDEYNELLSISELEDLIDRFNKGKSHVEAEKATLYQYPQLSAHLMVDPDGNEFSYSNFS
jgi:hypothetical protein